MTIERSGMVLLAALALLSAPARAETVPACQTGRLRCGASKVVPVHAPPGTEAASAPAAGLGAADIAAAYNVDTTRVSQVTVAVVAAFGYPAVESDLAVYRTQYNLPACTVASGCLTVLNQNGLTTPLPAAPPKSDDWTVQSALSLDMVSATCPSCKLLLIEANTDSDDGLLTVQAVAAHAGATVFVNNWGAAEDSTAPALDADFDLPGVSNFVSAGFGYNDVIDNPSNAAPLFPATSEHVITVSGTSLVKGVAGRGWTETATKNSASGCSTQIALPAFQQQAVTGCAKRAYSDIAAVGDPDTGVDIYNAGGGQWIVAGGGASAVAAGIVAQSGRAGVGPAFFYANPTVLYDITSGTDGTCAGILCQAAAGWDGPSGNGSLNGGALAALPTADAGVPDGGHAAGGAAGGAGAAAGGAGGAHAGGGEAGVSAGGAGGAAGASAGGAGGTSAGGAAGASAGGATGGVAAGGASGTTKTSSSSGCGCTLTGREANFGGGIFVALALALTVRRRRRDR